MPEDYESVRALTPAEAAALSASFALGHRPAHGGNQVAVLWAAATSPIVILTSLIKFSRDVAFYGVVYCKRAGAGRAQ